MKRKRGLAALLGCREIAPWVLLVACFLAGILLGVLNARHFCAQEDVLLSEFLTGSETFDEAQPFKVTFARYLFLYLRYPVAAFLLAFTTFGFAVFPVLTILFGYSLSFASTCFAAVYGTQGTVAAFALFGLRSLITVPCFFLVAVPAWQSSFYLLRSSVRRRPVETADLKRLDWFRTMIVALILTTSACAEALLSPKILKLLMFLGFH